MAVPQCAMGFLKVGYQHSATDDDTIADKLTIFITLLDSQRARRNILPNFTKTSHIWVLRKGDGDTHVIPYRAIGSDVVKQPNISARSE